MNRLSFQCNHRFPGGFTLDVAFEADPLVTALFGPSGSGKTSVLSAIAGFLCPSSGRVVLGEHVVFDTNDNICVGPEKRQVGVVFQDHLLFPHMTVDGNLRYGRKHRRRPNRRVDHQRVVDVLENQTAERNDLRNRQMFLPGETGCVHFFAVL